MNASGVIVQTAALISRSPKNPCHLDRGFNLLALEAPPDHIGPRIIFVKFYISVGLVRQDNRYNLANSKTLRSPPDIRPDQVPLKPNQYTLKSC